jgi:hypothetical protein
MAEKEAPEGNTAESVPNRRKKPKKRKWFIGLSCG